MGLQVFVAFLHVGNWWDSASSRETRFVRRSAAQASVGAAQTLVCPLHSDASGATETTKGMWFSASFSSMPLVVIFRMSFKEFPIVGRTEDARHATRHMTRPFGPLWIFLSQPYVHLSPLRHFSNGIIGTESSPQFS